MWFDGRSVSAGDDYGGKPEKKGKKGVEVHSVRHADALKSLTRRTGSVEFNYQGMDCGTFYRPSGLYLRVIQFNAVSIPLIAQARLNSGKVRSRSDWGRWASI